MLIQSIQHGFQKDKSTDTALLQFYDFVTSSNDNNSIVDAVFFDLSKAFHTVPHHKLAARMYNTGVQGQALEWIKDFLSFSLSNS